MIECNDGCGNPSDFTEITITKWAVDGEGSREEKIDEETRFVCNNCGADAE